MNLLSAEALATRVLEETGILWTRAEIAGSIRRMEPVCHDVDIVVVPRTCYSYVEGLLNTLRAAPGLNPHVIKSGYLLNSINVTWAGRREQVDFYFCIDPRSFGIQLQCRTGSAAFNIGMAARAKSMGLHYHATKGILKPGDIPVARETEQEVFEVLGLHYIEPEMRRSASDVARAVHFRPKEDQWPNTGVSDPRI